MIVCKASIGFSNLLAFFLNSSLFPSLDSDDTMPTMELKIECDEDEVNASKSEDQAANTLEYPLLISPGFIEDEKFFDKKSRSCYKCTSCDFQADKVTEIKKHKRRFHKES